MTKVITSTQLMETEIMLDNESYMVWEYTNTKNERIISIMDNRGFDVSYKYSVIDHGEILNQSLLYCSDPEEYVEEQFNDFKIKYNGNK